MTTNEKAERIIWSFIRIFDMNPKLRAVNDKLYDEATELALELSKGNRL